MKTNGLTLGGKLIGILFFNILVGHYFPPTGIFSIPIVISLATGLIVFNDNDLTIFQQILLVYGFIALNDIGTKLFAGGIHDWQGLGWIHAMLFASLIPCFIMLVIGAFRDKTTSVNMKVLSLSLFPLLIYVHLVLFVEVGLVTHD